MSSESLGFSTSEALLYLCASRCSLGRLSKILVGATGGMAAIAGLVYLLTG